MILLKAKTTCHNIFTIPKKRGAKWGIFINKYTLMHILAALETLQSSDRVALFGCRGQSYVRELARVHIRKK